MCLAYHKFCWLSEDLDSLSIFFRNAKSHHIITVCDQLAGPLWWVELASYSNAIALLQGLREMLQIAMKAGSLANPQLFDVDTQTDCCITGMDSPPNFSPNTDTIKLNPHFSPHSSSSSSESPSHASASSEALSSGTCCEVSPTQESIVEDTESVEEDASW